MSVDKLVDSTQLDADLTSVANAIRTKGGTSASLAFPAGFVSAVAAIPTGGGGSGVSGTFTPSSDVRSITLSDCIGKTNIFVFPAFNLDTSTIANRIHWGGAIIGGNAIVAGSTNSGKSGYTLASTTKSASGSGITAISWDSSTGTYTIVAGSGSNYGGYFCSGRTFGYVAW